MTPLWALMQAGYRPSRIILSTLQAVSGAGYPGVASLDIIDNVIPFIKGEEEKSELEPLKVFGQLRDGAIVSDDSIRIAAHCNRVPVIHGHTACVSVEFSGAKPKLDEVVAVWNGFRGEPQKLELPFAPRRPIVYNDAPNRPQPQKDRDCDKAMAVTVGRLRSCPVFDIRFVGLHHNTVRGAAGGAILTAELMKARGYIG
jgi:aspartate-semialdehyde dehydrogenase